MGEEVAEKEKLPEVVKADLKRADGGKGKGRLALVYLLLLAAGLFLGILFGYLI